MDQNNSLVSDEKCDSTQKPIIKDDCNTKECDDDQMVAIGVCKDSDNGCCPDHTTTADDSYSGCPPIDVTDGCNATEFGCCKDMETAAFGPFQKGCPFVCNFTRFGCCPDGMTAANSSSLEECPQDIETTTFVTTETTTMEAITTTITPKELDELSLPPEECTEDGSVEGSGEPCLDKTSESFNIDIPSPKCANSTFGCCPDGLSAATGENFEGCDEGSGQPIEDAFNCTDGTCILSTTEGTGTLDCNATEFGCCPNGKKMATGPRFYGCTCEDCESFLTYYS